MSRVRRVFNIVLPLVLLITGFWVYDWWEGRELLPTDPETPVVSPVDDVDPGQSLTRVATAVSSSQFTPVPATSTATPTATPTTQPTATATPTLPPDAAISQLGPPDGATFRRSDEIVFYWKWPIWLGDDQVLSVYLLFDGEPYLLGSVADEPNFGQQYRLSARLPEGAVTAASVQWQIWLEAEGVTAPLRVSETRQLAILP